MKILGIIPARFASSRLEGKPLIDIAGKTMIRRVYEQAKKAKLLTTVIVATDDHRIIDECKTHNINYIMTSMDHINGTERCAEVVENIAENYDIIINIQGDEPFIHSESIDELIRIFINNPLTEIGTLIKKIDKYTLIENPNIIKVVFDHEYHAIYFSRSPIPFQRDIPIEHWLDKSEYYKHIGMYGFKTETLINIVNLPESHLESAEKLEQLRWLENGYTISVCPTIFESKSVDTIEDYNYILNHLSTFIHD